MKIECLVDAKAKVGESPVWSAKEAALYWVDIDGCRLYRTTPDGATRGFAMPEEIGCIALRAGGGLIAGMRRGLAFINAEGGLERLANPEPERPDHRFNDGTVDPRGRFWAGTMRMAHAGKAGDGHLYRVGPDLAPARMASGFWTVNGLAFSPDGRTMYMSDSNADVRLIWAADYDPGAGTFSNRRVFFDTRAVAGRPDGGATDAEGCYWMAGVGGWQLVRLTPAGTVDRVIDFPVERPSKVAFGGADLKTLYVTTISAGVTSEQPQAGGLFVIEGVGIQGAPMPAFAG